MNEHHIFPVPGPPTELRILGSTITQLKIGWDPPDNPNGVLREYYIYQGMKEHLTWFRLFDFSKI